jgi:hypothetical protein
MAKIWRNQRNGEKRNNGGKWRKRQSAWQRENRRRWRSGSSGVAKMWHRKA